MKFLSLSVCSSRGPKENDQLCEKFAFRYTGTYKWKKPDAKM